MSEIAEYRFPPLFVGDDTYHDLTLVWCGRVPDEDFPGSFRNRWMYGLFQVRDGEKSAVFIGHDLQSSNHESDPDRVAVDLMGFLTLKDGDVESEYWAEHEYTARQLAWRDEYAEALSVLFSTEDGELESLSEFRS